MKELLITPILALFCKALIGLGTVAIYLFGNLLVNKS